MGHSSIFQLFESTIYFQLPPFARASKMWMETKPQVRWMIMIPATSYFTAILAIWSSAQNTGILTAWQAQSSSPCRVGFESSPFWHYHGRKGARNSLRLPMYEQLQETKRLLRSTRLIVPALYGLCVNVCILSDFMHMWRSAVPGMHGGWHAVAGRMGSTVVIGKLLMSWLSTVHIM